MVATKVLNKKKLLAPKLRFKDFNDSWSLDNLGNVTKVTSGGTPSRGNKNYWNGNVPWITTSLIDFNLILKAEEYITQEGVDNSSSKIFPKGTILMAMYGQGKTRGKVAVLGIEATTNQACAAIMVEDKIYNDYLFQNLAGRYDEIRDLSNEGGQQNLSGGIIKGIKFSFPTLPEQQKIASFLSAVDEKIQQLSRKKELLEQYKKGIMQQLFSGKLRFKNENGKAFPKWEEKRLKEITIEVKRDLKDKSDFSDLEVLTISSEKGFISQKERFSQVIAGESLSKYTLLGKGGMSYNRGASKRFKYGCFFLLDKLEQALVPNVYISFEFKSHCIPDYFNQLFSTGYANNQLKKFISSSVRLDGLLNINREDFFSIMIQVPSLLEQKKIANYLSNIDSKIGSINKQITQTQTFKKGLLQQMFA